MDFGVNLLTRGITGNADGLLSMARQAEAPGFGHITVNTGRGADVASDIAGFTSAGVAHFFLSFPAPSLSEALDDLSWFAQDVRPLIKP